MSNPLMLGSIISAGRIALVRIEAERQMMQERDNMNTAPKTEETTTGEEPIKQTKRTNVIARISEARISQPTKKFAKRLLKQNYNVGSIFSLPMTALRQLRHAETNLDVVKSFRKLRAAGLMAYEINHQTQIVSMRFMVK